MKNVAYTLEDCLEILVGLKGQAAFQIENSDRTILQSIGRQVFKGVALTDRQHRLVREKLENYRDQFTALEYNIDTALDSLRMPLRIIDRSKHISVVSHSEMIGPNQAYETYKNNWKWIKIRFPFSKKLIIKIEAIRNTASDRHYNHKKGSHEHFFYYNERMAHELVDAFKDCNFTIEQDLLDLYETTKQMKDNPQDYIPGIYNFELKNLNDTAVDYMISAIGKPNIDNLALYKDRKDLFGLHYFDQDDLDTSINQLTTLSQKVVNRKSVNVLVKPGKYNTHKLGETLLELNRFPLLVVLTENNALEELHQIHKALDGFIDRNESTVLFRLDNNKNSEFNDYVKNNNLNAPLDKDTKVVYISNNKVPKPLVASDWAFTTVLLFSSTMHGSKTQIFIKNSDLVIHYDETASQFMRFRQEGIQEL